jgi:DNA-binding transcriptional LysR family regulator
MIFSRFARYFEEVARRGSIRRAAERLNVAPSAIDRQLIRVEQELGMQLFERMPQGLRLTAAGEMLVHGLRQWQRDFERVRSQIEDLRGLRRGEVTLAAVEGTTDEFLPDVLAAFNRDYPGILCNVVVAGSDSVQQLVRSGEADLGLIFNPRPRLGLRVEHAHPFRLGVVMPPDHPLASRTELRLSDCAPHAVVIPDDAISLRAVLNEALEKTGVQLRPVAVASSISLIKSLVLRGLGIGLLTRMDALTEIRTGQLRYVPLLDRVIPPSVLSLVTAVDRIVPVPASLLVHQMGTALGELAADVPELQA